MLNSIWNRVLLDAREFAIGWNQFWFEPKRDMRTLYWFRFLTGLILIFFYSLRLSDFDYLFSDHGMSPLSSIENVAPGFISPVWLKFMVSSQIIHLYQWALLFTLVFVTIGLGGRWVTIIAFILQAILSQRNLSANYGADFVATFWMLCLCFMKAPKNPLSYWKNLFQNKSASLMHEESDWLTTIGWRFLQIQICVIYFYGAIEKLRGVTWWSGTALWHSLSNNYLIDYDFGFLVHFSFLTVSMTFITLLWEGFFPVLVWKRSLRPYILVMGVLFHIGILISMKITFFSLLMMVGYLSFLDPQTKKGLN